MKRFLSIFVSLAVALGALQAQNVVSLRDIMLDDETAVLYISLENEVSFSGFQMDLKLPDGFEARDVQLCEGRKKASHNLSYNVQGNGAIRMLSYSNNNETFTGTSGALVQVEVARTAMAKEGRYEAVLSNVIFTTPEAVESRLGEAKGEVYFPMKYQMTLKSDGHGSVAGSGVYIENTQVIVSATPDEGYHFVKWSDGSIANPYTFVASQPKELTAEFAPNTYYVTYMVDGVVMKKEPVLYGATITLAEVPTMVGHTFSGWQDVLATMPARDITISGTFTANNYLVTFKIGGEVISSSSLAFGSAIVPPEAPAKEGHTFLGWGDVAATVPAGNVTYEGSYSVNSYQLTYTVDGETVKAESVVYGTAITLLEEPSKEGYTFSGWQDVFVTMPARDIAISGTFTVNNYLVTFKIGDEVISSSSLAFGSAIVSPEAPAKEGHTFLGWGDVAATVPAGNVTYEGSYSVNSYQLTYIVDGETVKTESVVYGTAITLFEEPTKEGYTFSGWQGVFETMPACDKTISGTFTVNKYNVSFVIDGVEIDSKSLDFGSPIVAPAAPELEGHTFAGWSNMLETVPSRDIVFEGNYSANSYQLTYTVDGETVKTESVIYGTAIILLDEPTKEGHTFSGWQDALTTMPARDITISGTFTVNNYLVTFKIGDEVISSSSLAFGSAIVSPEAPAKEGHTFLGWGDVATTVPAGNVTYEGRYSANSYQLTYIVDGETVKTESVVYGTAITLLEEPTKEGHTFSGWQGVFETMPACDKTISGTFTINKYLVTFMIDGEIVSSDSLEYGALIEVPEAQDREGYTFSGWGDVLEMVPARDVIYDANYVVNEYRVYYFVGSKLVHSEKVAYGDVIPEYVYEPTTEGEIFVGWIGDSYETMPSHDVTYKAEIKIADNIEVKSNDASQLVVYDLTGHKVLVDDVRELSKGIYIINGCKVLIK